MTSAYRSRSPVRENKTQSSSSFGGRRENWRLRQERSYSRDDSFIRPRGEHYRGDRERRPYRGGRQNWRERSRSESETYRERGRREWRRDNPEQEKNTNQENDAGISDDLAGDQPGRGGQSGRYKRRQSSEAETESSRPLVLNPTDVPRAERYFTHDDRLTAFTRRGPRSVPTPAKWGHDGFEKMNTAPKPTHQPNRRTRIGSTPLKWDHDMFEKIKHEDEKELLEATPPPEDGSEIPRTRSVVSKVTVPETCDIIVFNEDEEGDGDGVE